jgi:hypothetical protein
MTKTESSLSPDTSTLKPRILYKYRRFLKHNYPAHLDHLNILRNKKIYFASPESFNDPFDCLMPQRFDLLSEDEYHKKKLRIIHGISNNEVSDERKKLIPENMTPEETVKFYFTVVVGNPRFPQYSSAELNRMMEFQLKNLREHVTIFSLSNQCNQNLMWAHYSDNHTGFSLGFDTELLFQCTKVGIGRVEYSDYFDIKPISSEKYHLAQVLTKSTNWKYEEEWRFIHWDKKNEFDIDPNCIKEIIIGCRATKSNSETIINLVDADPQLSHVSIRQAVKEPFSFDLRIEEVGKVSQGFARHAH